MKGVADDGGGGGGGGGGKLVDEAKSKHIWRQHKTKGILEGALALRGDPNR